MHYLQRTLHLPGILCSKHHYNRAISEILKHPGNIIFHVFWLFELQLGLEMQVLKYIRKSQSVYVGFTVQIFRPKGGRYFCYIIFIEKIKYP